MSAATGCTTGGVCAVGSRVTDAIRGMRERDGRCVGCGRAITAFDDIEPKQLREWGAELDAIASPTISAPERAPADAATSSGSEPTTSGAESAPVVTMTAEVRAQLDAAGPAGLDLLEETPGRRIARQMTEQLDRIKLETSDDPAVVALRATSPEGLVDTVIQLTHQIHGCLDGKHDARAADLRAQRALVKAEIVRRAS